MSQGRLGQTKTPRRSSRFLECSGRKSVSMHLRSCSRAAVTNSVNCPATSPPPTNSSLAPGKIGPAAASTPSLPTVSALEISFGSFFAGPFLGPRLPYLHSLCSSQMQPLLRTSCATAPFHACVRCVPLVWLAWPSRLLRALPSLGPVYARPVYVRAPVRLPPSRHPKLAPFRSGRVGPLQSAA